MRRCLLLLVTALSLLTPAASAHPTSRDARRWRPPGWWLAQASCVHRHESVDWHRAGRDWAGSPSPYYGGMQFLVSTWHATGGLGLPSSWSAREQLYRAFLVWRRDGGSWSEWGTAAVCGLR
jgi:hypothetical protein